MGQYGLWQEPRLEVEGLLHQLRMLNALESTAGDPVLMIGEGHPGEKRQVLIPNNSSRRVGLYVQVNGDRPIFLRGASDPQPGTLVSNGASAGSS